MPLFGKSQRSPADLVKTLRDALDVLEKSQDKKKLEKVSCMILECHGYCHFNSKNIYTVSKLLSSDIGDNYTLFMYIRQLALIYFGPNLFWS